MVKFVLILGLTAVVNPAVTFAQPELWMKQKRDTLKQVEHLLEELRIEDSLIINQLIEVWNNPTTDDSVRVEIAHFIRKNPHPKGIRLLIDNIERTFVYGVGYSDIDQYNTYASRAILGSISSDEYLKWHVLMPIFDSLKNEKKSEIFLLKLGSLLPNVFTKEVSKIIIEIEIQNSRRIMGKGRNLIYEDNLLRMLKNFE